MAQSDMEDQSTNNFLSRGYDYKGTLGKDTIGMFIGRDSIGGLKGHYFYHRDLKDKALIGEILSPIDIVLYEMDSSSNKIGTFKLQADKGLPSVGLMTSLYTKRNGDVDSISITVVGSPGMGEERYSEFANTVNFEENVQTFYYALLAGDKQTVIKCIEYPLHVYPSQGKEFVIKNKKQLFKKFDIVFTSEKISLLRRKVPHDLFVRHDGVEMGGIWFNPDGLVFSVVH